MNRLALRLPNWLGDVIMTLPVIDALKALGFQLELLGKPWLNDLFSAYDYKIYPLSSSLFEARRVYQTISARDVVLFTNSIRSAAAVCFAQKNAVGYQQFGRGFFLQHGLKKENSRHETDYFWLLATYALKQIFGLDNLKTKPSLPQLKLTPSACSNANQYLENHHINKDFLVICPGAIGRGVHGESRIWVGWKALIEQLLNQGKTLITCPGPQEVDSFSAWLPKEVKQLNGVNLSTYAAIMQQANYVIANDSGPSHLAAAVGTPVFGLYGVTSPERTAPKNAHILGSLGKWPTVEDVIQCLEERQ